MKGHRGSAACRAPNILTDQISLTVLKILHCVPLCSRYSLCCSNHCNSENSVPTKATCTARCTVVHISTLVLDGSLIVEEPFQDFRATRGNDSHSGFCAPDVPAQGRRHFAVHKPTRTGYARMRMVVVVVTIIHAHFRLLNHQFRLF